MGLIASSFDNLSEQADKHLDIQASDQLKPNELEGRVRIGRFYFKPTAAVAADENVALCYLPKGARIVEIIATSNAFVATADLQIGLKGADGSGYITADDSTTADSTSFFGSGLDVATAGAYAFADTQAKNYGYELEKACWLVGELKTAGMDGSADVLVGHVLYVVD